MKVSEFYSKFIFPPHSRFKPYEHQALMWEKFFINSSKGEPILLRAPTGSGKTEAIIAPFLEQFVEEKFVVAPRLIYVLPMRALANQIFENSTMKAIKEKAIFAENSDPEFIKFVGEVEDFLRNKYPLNSKVNYSEVLTLCNDRFDN